MTYYILILVAALIALGKQVADVAIGLAELRKPDLLREGAREPRKSFWERLN